MCAQSQKPAAVHPRVQLDLLRTVPTALASSRAARKGPAGEVGQSGVASKVVDPSHMSVAPMQKIEPAAGSAACLGSVAERVACLERTVQRLADENAHLHLQLTRQRGG